MSVTVYIESVPTGHFVVRCYEQGDAIVERADSYDGILAGITRHKAACPECDNYGCYSEAVMDIDGAPEVNMANANFADVAHALGLADGDFSDWCCGSIDADDLLARIAIADALAPVSEEIPAGLPVNTVLGVAAHGGRERGYVQRRLDDVREVAVEAKRLNRSVVWA
jgi:hypothetical protein